jgi:hypothetical protein
MKTNMNDRLQAPVALNLKQKFPIFYGLRVGLAPEPVRRCEEEKNFCTLPRTEPQHHSDPASSLVTIPTELSRLLNRTND